jgi:hypothetical protein
MEKQLLSKQFTSVQSGGIISRKDLFACPELTNARLSNLQDRMRCCSLSC